MDEFIGAQINVTLTIAEQHVSSAHSRQATLHSNANARRQQHATRLNVTLTLTFARLFLCGEATNFAGLHSAIVSPPIYSVITPPVQIADGSSPFAMWVGSTEIRARVAALYPGQLTGPQPQPHAANSFALHWTPLMSSLSVAEPSVQYEYAIGTSFNGHQLLSWTLIANPREPGFVVQLASPVAGGTKLWIEMRARGCSGLISLAHESVVVDVSPPSIDSIAVRGTQVSNGVVLSLPELQQFTFTVQMHDHETPMYRMEWSDHSMQAGARGPDSMSASHAVFGCLCVSTQAHGA